MICPASEDECKVRPVWKGSTVSNFCPCIISKRLRPYKNSHFKGTNHARKRPDLCYIQSRILRSTIYFPHRAYAITRSLAKWYFIFEPGYFSCRSTQNYRLTVLHFTVRNCIEEIDKATSACLRFGTKFCLNKILNVTFSKKVKSHHEPLNQY